ncbi:MAG: hypothetical protein KIS68_06825 [Bauldia sp.]|nr:hypothetical protein [Bauldia sp.]
MASGLLQGGIVAVLANGLGQLLSKTEHALTLVAGNAAVAAAIQEVIDLARRGLAFRRPGKDDDADA